MSENFDPTQSESSGKRARDADREQVMGLLDGALADGQLDGFEHRERVARALRSGTLGELGATVADLQVATPTFLLPPVQPPTPPAPAVAPPPRPAPPAAPRLAAPTPAGPSSGGTGSDRTTSTVASMLAAAAVVIILIVIGANVGKSDDTGVGPLGAKPGFTMCDGDGKNCKDENGRSVPDMPRDQPPIDGVALVGNPMASTNVRKAYESMVTALAPTSVISLSVTKWSANAEVVRADDPSRSQKWTLSGGVWKYAPYDRGNADAPGFAPTAMNLDRITAAIADAPGITRAVREPTSVEFAASAVTIAYSGPNDASPTLILAPDGTVVD